MGWLLEDVGLAADGALLTEGVHWSLAARGLYQLPSTPAADVMGGVLAREQQTGVRVLGRISHRGLDWRICPPAVRVKERRRVATQEVLSVLGFALPPESAVAMVAGDRAPLQEQAERRMRRLGVDVPLSSTVGDLTESQRLGLEVLRATLAEPSLVWVDGVFHENALRELALDCAVVVVGILDGATPLSLPPGGDQPPVVPPKWVRWVFDRQLGGMRRPGAMGDIDGDVAALRELSVTRVVGLEETPIVADAVQAAGIEHTHFPIVDMTAPPLEPTRSLVRDTLGAIADGERVLFHCKAGLGRTGTLLCACLVEAGYGVHQALSLLRQLRLEYVQSDAQLRFLRHYEAVAR